jgi:hypothetical protein
MLTISDDEIKIYNEVAELVERLHDLAEGIFKQHTGQKVISCILHKRLCTNQRGFKALWEAGLDLEASIILRSAIESAICLAANFKLAGEFVSYIKRDAAKAAFVRININQKKKNYKNTKYYEGLLELMKSRLPTNSKPAFLDWSNLAEIGSVPQLYTFHKMLSGVSSHVTGIYLLRGVETVETHEINRETEKRDRASHFAMMTASMLIGAEMHATMIEAHAEVAIAIALKQKLANLARDWPDLTVV